MEFICSVAETTNTKETLFAYCVDRTKDGVEWIDNYNLKVTKKLDNNKIYSVIMQGYPVKSVRSLGASSRGMAFMATKQAIYSEIYNRKTSDYIPKNTAEGRKAHAVYSKILNNARKNQVKYVEPKLQVLVSQDWSLDETNTYLEKRLKINSNIKDGEYDVKIKDNKIGAELLKMSKDEIQPIMSKSSVKKDISNLTLAQELKVRVSIENINKYFDKENEVNTFKGENKPLLSSLDNNANNNNESNVNSTSNNNKEEIESVLRIPINIKAKVKSYPVYYGKSTRSDAQDCVIVGKEYEELELNEELEIKRNNTILEINKIDKESKRPLEGVIFNIYKDDELVYENLKSNKEGKVVIKNILPGTYIIKEIKAKEGYELSKNPVVVYVELDEENVVNIENKKIPPKDPPKQKEKSKPKKLPYTGLF